MMPSIFLLCCAIYGIASLTTDFGNGNVRYEDGKFVKYEGKPTPEALPLYRPILFANGIGMLIHDFLALLSFIAIISVFVVGLLKLDWYITAIGFAILIPLGKLIGKLLIKCPIGGIVSPLSNLIVIILTTAIIIQIFG